MSNAFFTFANSTFIVITFYMKTTEIIIDLLEHLDSYLEESERIKNEATTTDFIGYMNTHFKPQAVRRDKISGGLEEDFVNNEPNNTRATDISILITLMFRYAKMYIKKALKDSNIRTADEFSFMITLMTHESMTKKDLIRSQVMEKTSGIEVINRLIKMGYVEQFQDQNDKRSKFVRITASGRYELISVLPMMSLVSKIVIADLSPEEQNQLSYMLRKLDHFHNEVYMNEKELVLEEILQKTQQ